MEAAIAALFESQAAAGMRRRAAEGAQHSRAVHRRTQELPQDCAQIRQAAAAPPRSRAFE